MEAYSGVLVCCTNLLKNLDSAVLRRFTFKVEFKPLTEEGRFLAFERYFPEEKLSAETAEHLARLDGLTPGDFKAVLSQARFGAGLCADVIVEKLEAEISYKNPVTTIGFQT
jgi:SpoVK/Ycf46/Vps4 family AAA+-type ATPase